MSVESMTEALRAEFDGEVTFLAQIPKTLVAPAIVVSPGEPFLQPRDVGSPLVYENWLVLVAVSIKDVASGLKTMRKNSLRVRKVVNKSGGTWVEASGPRLLQGESAANSETVVSLNNVRFRYDHKEITEP